ncbi:unnamed protein product [Lymnaea stagnalis]|uniref:Major facilitator superfamily (MFS) profile domain-containing protein n=1 Tax=Lymnaea stagnalis TaxID=6523 RepID=A0AAV2H7Q9_LYMST
MREQDTVSIKPNETTSDGDILGASAGKHWTKKEKLKWMTSLFIGTATLYAARTIMPVCIVSVSQEMGWDKTESGSVLSGFFWGYTMTQFLGGYLSDRIGGDIVLPIAACLWSLIIFWTPQLVYMSTGHHTSLYIMVMSRVALGVCQGFHYPGMTSLISRKVSEQERSFTYSVISSGSMFGTLLVGCIGSLLMEFYGWPLPFYFIGLFGLIWMLYMRYILIPQQAKSLLIVSLNEAQLLESKQIKAEVKPSVPWVTLFTKSAFWSLLIGHYCENNAFYILLSWMPTYFHENFPTAKSWIFNVVPWLVTIPSTIGSGWLADHMIAKGYSVTFVRKTMQTVTFLGTAFFLFLISYVKSYEACLACMALAVACCGFHHSGISVNPQDIAPKHAGSVFGLMNMAGAIPGFIGVYIAGHVLEVTKSWNAVFGQTALVNVFGWIVYTTFGTGKKVV